MMQTLASYAIAALLVFLAGFGTGQKLERSEFEKFKAVQEAAAYKQQVKNVVLFETQTRENKEVQDEMQTDIKGTNDKFLALSSRVRNRATGAVTMPENGGPACGNNDPAGDYRLLEVLRAAELQALRLKGCQAILRKTYQKFR